MPAGRRTRREQDGRAGEDEAAPGTGDGYGSDDEDLTDNDSRSWMADSADSVESEPDATEAAGPKPELGRLPVEGVVLPGEEDGTDPDTESDADAEPDAEDRGETIPAPNDDGDLETEPVPDGGMSENQPAEPDLGAGQLGEQCSDAGDCALGDCAESVGGATVCCESACDGLSEECSETGECERAPDDAVETGTQRTCAPECPCDSGEGVCSSDAVCVAGLVCIRGRNQVRLRGRHVSPRTLRQRRRGRE